MRQMQRMAAVAALAISSFATVGVSAASADDVSTHGGCGNRGEIRTSGALAHVTLSCHDGKITVQGWVKDTARDGQCAQGYGKGGSANLYLREIG